MSLNHFSLFVELDIIPVSTGFTIYFGFWAGSNTNCDILCIDSIYNYNLNATPGFIVLLDQLIKLRLNHDRPMVCSIGDRSTDLPLLGPVFNQFIRDSYVLKLPEPSIKNENSTTRHRNKTT